MLISTALLEPTLEVKNDGETYRVTRPLHAALSTTTTEY